MITPADLAERIRQHGSAVRGGPTQWSAQCPAHDDRAPSLSIGTGTEGVPLVHCQAGCPTEEVLSTVGLTLADLMPDRDRPERPRVVATYPYVDENGVLLYEVRRIEPGPDGRGKTFRPYRPGAHRPGLGDVRRVLYRLPEVIQAAAQGGTVYVCEGEKDVEALASRGYTATCNVGGAGRGKWKPEYSQCLTGAHVVVVADRDAPGIAHARAVADALTGHAASVRIMLPAVATPHADVSDHLAAGYGVDELVPLGDEPQDDATEVDSDDVDSDDVDEHGRPRLRPRLTRLSDVQPVAIDWLWRGRIARGKLHIIDGQPGVGKSTLTMDLVARLTTGAPWPDGEPTPGPAGVVVLTAEDGLSDTVRPRLDAAGGNPDHVVSLDEVRYYDEEGRIRTRLPTIADLDALRDAIAEVNATLVIIDPLAAYVGDKINLDKDSQVRTVLTPLANLAEELGVAVLIVRHPRKSGGRALHAGAGSLGIIGAARIGWTVAAHPDEPETSVLAISKANIARKAASLTYRLESAGQVETPTGVIDVSRVVWGGPIDMSADDLTDDILGETRTTTQECADWLRDWLRDQGGEAPRQEVLKAASAAGFSTSTLDRARQRAGLTTRRGGYPATSIWCLPQPPQAEETARHDQTVTNQDKRGAAVQSHHSYLSKNSDESEGSEVTEGTGRDQGKRQPRSQLPQLPQSPQSPQSLHEWTADATADVTDGATLAEVPEEWGEWSA